MSTQNHIQDSQRDFLEGNKTWSSHTQKYIQLFTNSQQQEHHIKKIPSQNSFLS